MWIIFTLVSILMQGTVNYIDEYLTNNNKLPEKTNIHTKIGGLLLISTLMSFVGAIIIGLFTRQISLPPTAFYLAIASAIPMVTMYASYFYLLVKYPVHQVGPLFQISTLWLLAIELINGGNISTTGLIGILIMIYGAYLLDAGTFKWKIPTQLLLISIPATFPWAISLYMVRIASATGSPIAITFWQMIGVGTLGITLFFLVKKYRDGFLFRMKHQGKNFLGFSLLNESLAEGSFLFSNMAVAIVPVAAYVTAMSGVQSVFILALFYFFPQGKRSHVKPIQWLAVTLIALGLYFLANN